LLLISVPADSVSAQAGEGAFLPRVVTSSTVPANGDLNPYGVAFVPQGFPSGGKIAPGDVLISNFNNAASNVPGGVGNVQGTGTTIVKLTPDGTVSQAGGATTFFTSSSTFRGLDTALGVLKGGFVLVGNLPTTDGTAGTITQGALQVINSHGQGVNTLMDNEFLPSPWDLAINDDGDHAQVFVSNVVTGQPGIGTVSRLDLAVGGLSGVTVRHMTTIATGYTSVPNQAAVILGPTGLAYDKAADILYVASTADSTIYAVPNAGHATSPVNKGNVIFAGPQLFGPLALVFAPNGNLLTANGDAVPNADPSHPSEIVEFTKSGQFVRQFNVDASPGGAFGIATVLSGTPRFNFAVVDDVTNVVSVYSLPINQQ
jgi:hypothetical protein